jgi:hypothetical protein
MEQIIEWAAVAVFFITPLYFMLRFRLPGLFLSVLGLWVAFGVLSEFFPLSRPGWEPLRSPLAFLFGLVSYLIPFLVIYGLKQLLMHGLRKGKTDDDRSA